MNGVNILVEKHQYTHDDYYNRLQKNLKNAINIAGLFDSGNFDTADQLTGIIRSLVHDTKHSISILQRLEVKNTITYVDTTIDYPNDTFHLQNMLFVCGVKLPGGKNYKRLVLPKHFFVQKPYKQISFDQWWNNTIFIINDKEYSRKNIILTAANKDGVLHPDKEVDITYYELANDIKSFAYFTETYDIGNPETVIEAIENSINSIIRQIAHELITTLLNYYGFDIYYGPPQQKIGLSKPIYNLEVAINPEFHELHKDIAVRRDANET